MKKYTVRRVLFEGALPKEEIEQTFIQSTPYKAFFNACLVFPRPRILDNSRYTVTIVLSDSGVELISDSRDYNASHKPFFKAASRRTTDKARTQPSLRKVSNSPD